MWTTSARSYISWLASPSVNLPTPRVSWISSLCLWLLALVEAFPLPSDKPALQRFLGMLNFYRKFLLGGAGVLDPLKDALKGPGKSLTWSKALDSTSPRAKDLLASILQSSCILALMLLSLLHWIPLTPMWVLFCNSNWMVLGPPCLSSPRSCLMLSGSTPPSTENSLPPNLLYRTSILTISYIHPRLINVDIPGYTINSLSLSIYIYLYNILRILNIFFVHLNFLFFCFWLAKGVQKKI